MRTNLDVCDYNSGYVNHDNFLWLHYVYLKNDRWQISIYYFQETPFARCVNSFHVFMFSLVAISAQYNFGALILHIKANVNSVFCTTLVVGSKYSTLDG